MKAKNLGLLILFIFISVATLAPVFYASAQYSCIGDACYYVACSNNSDCGNGGFYGEQVCQGNSIFQNYRKFTCLNPGTEQSYCSISTAPIYQRACADGQICQNGYCAISSSTYTAPSQPAQSTQTSTGALEFFVKHYRTGCYSNNLYWYDSNKNIQDISQNCQDQNSCTIDTCHDAACKNILTCDGSTCAINSADYNSYCASANASVSTNASTGNASDTTVSENDNTQTQTQTASQTPIQSQIAGQSAMLIEGKTQSHDLQVLLLVKKESDGDYQSMVSVANGEKINFKLVFSNNSLFSMDGLTMVVDIPADIEYSDNFKIDGVQSQIDPMRPVSFGTIFTGVSKEITFDGIASQTAKVAGLSVIATVSTSSVYNTASAQVDIGQVQQVKDNFAAALGASSIAMFFKKWFWWVLLGIVLVVLFIFIFQRLSKEA